MPLQTLRNAIQNRSADLGELVIFVFLLLFSFGLFFLGTYQYQRLNTSIIETSRQMALRNTADISNLNQRLERIDFQLQELRVLMNKERSSGELK